MRMSKSAMILNLMDNLNNIHNSQELINDIRIGFKYYINEIRDTYQNECRLRVVITNNSHQYSSYDYWL